MEKSINICLTINLGVSGSTATPGCIKAIPLPVRSTGGAKTLYYTTGKENVSDGIE